MGIRPATPGTIVVLAATVLLILVTVSTPLVKSLYFLKATIDTSVGNTDINGTVKLGTFGYCVGGTCTNAKLGYSLDIAELLGISGSLGGLSNSVLKWITYLLILHPIAAGFGAISVIFGLLAHTRGMAGTTLSTCFASFAATFALLAFIFDMAVFIIAKKRIESSDVGGKAELGNAIWMTLAALILYAISGFFFGCGACIIRKRRREQQVSDSYRPAVDPEYGAKLRAEAVQADYARKEASGAALPNFPEHVPLTAVHAVDYDDGYGHGAYGANGGYEPRQYASQSDISGAGGGAAPPSLISGVGEGYGRRNPAAPGLPVSFTPDTAPASLPPTSPVGAPAVAGVGARLGAEARANRGRATQEDERRLASGAGAGDVQGMYVPEGQYGAQDGYAPPQPHAAYGQMDYSPYGGAYPPYPSTTSPPPLPQQAGASHVQGYSSATPAPPPGGYGAAEKAQAQAQQPPVLPYRPSPSPSAQQQQQQQYYVQNGAAPSAYGDPFARAGETGSIAPTYYTHDQAGQPQGQGTQYHRGSVAGYQHQQQADPYGAPAGFDGSRRY
ncbi:hypothetical protein JCM10450v2_002934 [Rhodotorula kratochvilovae]